MQRTFLPRAQAHVLVVGDLILDRYVYGETARISPEAPVPVVRVGRLEERAGGAANVAVNLRALGTEVSVAGLCGEDTAADVLGALLEQAGVHCRFHRLASMQTVTKLRVVSQHQQLLRLDYEDAAVQTPVDFPGDTTALLEDVQCVVISDYAKGSLGRVQDLIAAARRRGLPVLVDPKGRDFGRYRGATLLTPNQREFEEVAGRCRGEAELASRAEQLREQLDLEALVVTRGERGMMLVQKDASCAQYLPALAQEIYDVTGAGDTVLATLAAALVSGYTLAEAAQFANAAAGQVVRKLGTATVTAGELNAALAGMQPVRRGILAPVECAAEIGRARQRGERVVFTNGCFDILHDGHVACLEAARREGDRLVVALNDDDSTRRLKGDGRPVNSLSERMRVLAALACVDWVTWFGEDTPQALIQRLAPDILVKGGDYAAHEVAGADFVRAQGGRVVIVPLVEGRSSTAIIDAAAAVRGRKTP